MERLCQDCKHYRKHSPNFNRPEDPFWCWAIDGQVNPVTGGDRMMAIPDLMRMTLCGWSDPKFWEPKSR